MQDSEQDGEKEPGGAVNNQSGALDKFFCSHKKEKRER